MTPAELRTLAAPEAAALPTLLHALWLDAHGDWAAAHSLVDELETPDACWVHAYLHRKNGEASNAAYWYLKAGKPILTGTSPDSLAAEWTGLATHVLTRR
jgi:hypothetical protein